MTSIFPGAVAGGLPVTSPLVENADIPPVEFDATCALFLPSDCTARILPSQINAISSELLNLAACFDPDGEWNCASLSNLCTAFTNYRTQTGVGTLDQDVQDLLCEKTSIAVPPNGSQLLFCDGNGNVHKTPFPTVYEGDGVTITTASPFSTIPDGVVQQICADDSAGDTLAVCLISNDDDNGLILGTDNRLFVPSHQIWFRHVDARIQTTNLVLNGAFFTGTFTIPNSSPYPIPVTLEAYTHMVLQHQGVVVVQTAANVEMQITSDAGFAVQVLTAHVNANISNNFYQVDPFQVNGTLLLIPPGGQQFFYRMVTMTVLPAGEWQMINPFLRVIANGVYTIGIN